MNLLNEGTPSNLLFVNFNQDATSLAVGTKNGYKLYSCNSADPLEKIHEERGEDVCLVERLFSSSLVALVSLTSPRKLKVCHFKKNTEICNYSYSNTILAVKLNRQRLVVCLEESLYIHNIRDMKLMHTIRDTPPNPVGLCALSTDDEHSLLAYPAHHTAGEVQIFDAIQLTNRITFAAHNSPLAALAFDSEGKKLATASEKGTVIRVHDSTTGNRLHEFRRGYARCATIYSLFFSSGSETQYLCASSNTETVHIFKLTEAIAENPPVASWTQALKDAAGRFLPQINDVMNQWRSFAHAKLTFPGLKNVCAVTWDKNNTPRVLVASADGFLYIYDFNEREGGECNLIKQHKLEDPEEGRGDEQFSPSSAGIAARMEGADDPAYDGDFPPMASKS